MDNQNFIPNTHILSVSELNEQAKLILEDVFPSIWVEGEISNLSTPASGHIYFSLKDSKAQISCAMFRGATHSLPFKPENGMHVLIQARATIYEQRGNFQLIAQQMIESGIGNLTQQFEKLKKELQQQGLFASEYKKPIPDTPKRIGIITSPTGAAIRDAISVLRRRCPQIPIMIYPTQVQGDEAAKQIAKAIEKANSRAECDVLILTRGGGSIEDLWSFNEEIVAHAIYKSSIPIVSGVGHEVDFTIADFVADMRAPTPSASAEIVAPNSQFWIDQLKHLNQQAKHFIHNLISESKLKLSNINRKIQHPGQKVQIQMQMIDHLESQLNSIIKLTINEKKSKIDKILSRISQMKHIILGNKQQKMSLLSQELETINPKNIIKRGYSITLNEETGEVIKSIKQIKAGDKIINKLADGEIISIISKISMIT